jgi:hypothetical protein
VTRTVDPRAADGAGQLRVRASSLFLARWGGRMHEVYVADDDRAFEDGAWFAAQRVYRRDLLTGDSALVFADPVVPRLAAAYAAAHPAVRLLDADESPPAPDDVDGEAHPAPPAAETSVALVAAHGPYLSVEQRTSGAADASGGGDALVRRVVDLRTGVETSLATLFGPAAGARVARVGRAAHADAVARLRDLARRRAAEVPADAAAARRALAAAARLRFDPANFGLAEQGGGPAVVFAAVGQDDEGAAITFALPPIPVAGSAPAWWRAEVGPALLGAGWRPTRGGYEVRARAASARGPAATAALELVAGPAAARRAWPLVRVPAGPAQLFALDDAATRHALRRAFDESAFYDDAITSVAWRPARRPVAAGSGRPAL